MDIDYKKQVICTIWVHLCEITTLWLCFLVKISYLCGRNGNSHNNDKKDKICQYKVKQPSKMDL